MIQQGRIPGIVRSPRPWAFLGAIALVLVAECSIATQEDGRFIDPFAWSWRETSKLCRRGAGAEVVCLGDSVMQYGLAPTIVGPTTGRRAVNLALSAGQAPASYFLLRNLVERGERPEAVVVDFLPNLLGESPRFNQANWHAILTYRDAVELSWASRDAGLFGTIALGKLVPSVRLRDRIRDNVKEAVRGEDRSSCHAVPLYLVRNRRVNHGATIVPGRDYAFNRPLRLEQGAWACHPANAAFLRKFLDLALTQRIAVFWALFPRHSGYGEAFEHLPGEWSGQSSLIREVVARYPNVTVIDGREARYPHAAFLDGFHFCREGVRVVSRDVAAIVRDALDAHGPTPRRVGLPDFRDLPREPDLEVEDTEQSRRFVRERSRREGLARAGISREPAPDALR